MDIDQLRAAMKRVKDDPYIPPMTMPEYQARVARYAWVAGRHAALQTCEDLLGLGMPTIQCYHMLKPWIEE